MIEELDRTFKFKIEQEVYKLTADIRQSPYDTDAAGPAGEAAIARMVEKTEMVEQLDKKASKIDYSNCMKYIDILHG